MMIETFGKYLSEKKLAELRQKTEVLLFGLVYDDHLVSPMADESTPIVYLYNHRFEYYKHPFDTFETFAELRKRHEFEVWATQTVGQSTGGSKEYHYDRSIWEPMRRDYLSRIAAQPMINTINSVHETFCISLMDSIACGHLVVAPNGVTFPELVPDGYPFLFRDRQEQVRMLHTIMNSWPKYYNEWRDRLVDHARKTFSIDLYAQRYIDLMWKVELEHRQTKHKPATRDALEKTFDRMRSGELYSPDDLRKALCRVKHFGNQSMPSRRVVREALRLRGDIRVVWKNGVKLVKE
jgi:glycosyltransferase involved in cell wall biosynthesis